MKRLGFCVVIWCLIAVAFSFAQDIQDRPSPTAPTDILGPQLVAWSHVQEPQPIPEPQSVQPDPSSGAVQVLMGTVVKDAGRYFLKVSKTSAYLLDDQQTAKRYEGKQVRATGVLDAKGTSFHVTKIELVS